MSGAEFVAAVGLAASIAQLIESTKKVISRIRQYKQGSAFDDVLPQLELFLYDVSRASQSFSPRQNKNDESSRTFLRVLAGCNRQMTSLNETIASVTPSTTSSSFRRTWIGLKSVSKDSKIREIMAILDRYRATLTLHMVSNLTHGLYSAAGSENDKRLFEVPRRRVAHFVGRKGLLQSLKTLLLEERECSSSGDTTVVCDDVFPCNVAVLVGLGGQGKTQTALELCRQCMNSFNTVLWINASSRNAALSDVKKIVRGLSTEIESFHDAQALLSFFHQWLRGLKNPWLLVFDNYDDPAGFSDITDFYPDYGSVVITSRHHSSKRLGVTFEVGALTDDEGVELLLRGARHDLKGSASLVEAKTVVAKLGHLALAIDQAASYISAHQMSLQMFAEVFESRREAILKHTPATWQYRAQTDNGQALSAFTTWEISINQAASNEGEREMITDFLTLLAFLESSSVNESLFSTYVEHRTQQRTSLNMFLSRGKWDSATFQDTVMSLVDMALVQNVDYDDGYLLISLHPVIKVSHPTNILPSYLTQFWQDWLQLRIPSSKQEMMVQDAVDLLAISITASENLDRPYRSRAALLKHIDAVQLNVAQFLKTTDSELAHGGYIQGQQAVFATFIGEHDWTMEAEILFAKVLSLQNKYLGPANIGTLATTNNLATLYFRLQRYEEVEKLLKKVLEGKEKLFPAGDFRITNTINALGNLYSQLGRFEEAKSLYLRNLETFLKSENLSVKNLKTVYCNLGEVAMRRGELGEAERMFENAFNQGKNDQPTCGQLSPHINSEDHLDEIDCQILVNKARLFKCRGQLDLAYDTCKKASQGLVALLGSGHSKTLAAEKELADIFQRSPQAADRDDLRHSGYGVFNPALRGACANWGVQMYQSQLMHLEREKNQTQMVNSGVQMQQRSLMQ